MPLEHDLGAGGHLQVAADAFHQLGLRAAQQTREGVFRQGVRHRRDGAEYRRRIRAQDYRDREILTADAPAAMPGNPARHRGETASA